RSHCEPFVSNSVKMTPIACPTWKPADAHVFSSDIAADGSQFLPTALALLNPPGTSLHTFIPDFGVGPGDAHAGPYDAEFSDGLSRLGFTSKRRFTGAEFSSPDGVWLVFMGIPRGARGDVTGKSPDFANGPIIADTVFPIVMT